jgi:triacylglycerol lipase
MDPMAGYLRRKGWKVLRPALLPGDGSIPIENLSEMLTAYINEQTGPNERIDLVGFSMGGLVCRHFLQYKGGAKRTDRFISISTPHAGSLVAYLFSGAGMRQMRPGSAFLSSLNRDIAGLANVICSVLYTPIDLIIIPSKSSLLPGSLVQRFLLPGHPLMIYTPAVFRRVAALLSVPTQRVA